jgi:hypothetical protein
MSKSLPRPSGRKLVTNRRILLSILAVISFLYVYILGYYSGYAEGRNVAVFLGRDTSDIEGMAQSRALGGFDQYFTRVNWIPGQAR